MTPYTGDTSDDSTAALCLAVRTATKLHAHLRTSRYGTWWEQEELPVALPEEESRGRALAEDAARAARRALDLSPSDNLAAVALGLARAVLGDDAAALAALRTALRLDPTDTVAATWLTDLGARPPAPLTSPPASQHPHAFFLLRHDSMVNNSGDRRECAWLFNDPADVRRTVDTWVREYPWEAEFDELSPEELRDYWDPESPDFDPAPDEDISVEVHVPGDPVAVRKVKPGLRKTSDWTAEVDWSHVPLPDALPAALPTGRPVRTGGRTYLFGDNAPDDL
ncbi:hypothetical protein [Streptomyces sp. NPDC053427]|uniref:hypothetical protein n=1 Tax=Streptomyces sp. NPDC053427 TaxID=3365701 RepID=UPI0037CE90E9